MFKFLFYGLLGITALLLYNCFNLFQMPTGSKDASLNTKLTFGAITIFCGLVSAIVFYFHKVHHQKAANLILYSFYGLLIMMTIYAASKARWN